MVHQGSRPTVTKSDHNPPFPTHRVRISHKPRLGRGETSNVARRFVVAGVSSSIMVLRRFCLVNFRSDDVLMIVIQILLAIIMIAFKLL